MANPHPTTKGRRNRPNKVTAGAVKRALEGGPLPAEQLLTLGRLAMGMCARLQPKVEPTDKVPLETIMKTSAWTEFKEWVRLAIDANNKAAPYYSYRLAAVKLEHGVPDLASLTNDELDTIERAAGIVAPGRGDPNGTGPKVH